MKLVYAVFVFKNKDFTPENKKITTAIKKFEIFDEEVLDDDMKTRLTENYFKSQPTDADGTPLTRDLLTEAKFSLN